jgi:hypothetical protein
MDTRPSSRFHVDMETEVRQFRDEAVVPDFCAPVRVIRFRLPAHLFSIFPIFKIADCQNLIARNVHAHVLVEGRWWHLGDGSFSDRIVGATNRFLRTARG